MELKYVDPWMNGKTEKEIKQFEDAKKEFLYFLTHTATHEDWLSILQHVNRAHKALYDISLLTKKDK